MSVAKGNDFLQDLPVEVAVVLGRARMTIREVACLLSEDIIELDRCSPDLIELVTGDCVLAYGERVVMKGRVGLRIVVLNAGAQRSSPQVPPATTRPAPERHEAPALCELKLGTGGRNPAGAGEAVPPLIVALASASAEHASGEPPSQAPVAAHGRRPGPERTGGSAQVSSASAPVFEPVEPKQGRLSGEQLEVAADAGSEAAWSPAPSDREAEPREQRPIPAGRSGYPGGKLRSGSSGREPAWLPPDGPPKPGEYGPTVPPSRLLEVGADLWNSLSRPLTISASLQAMRARGVPQRVRACPADPDADGGWQLRAEERGDAAKALVLHDPDTGEAALLPNFSRYSSYQTDYEFGGAMPTENFGRLDQIAIGRVDGCGRYLTTAKGRLLR